MIRRRLIAAAALIACAAAPAAQAQPVTRHLSLADAEAQALQNQPRIQASGLNAQAADAVTREVRAAYWPTLSASATGADALENTRITAGALNNPTILDRLAYGVTGTELLSDFGRTPALSATAALRAQASRHDVDDARAAVLLQVDRAYFDALRAQAVLRVANETLAARQLVVDQATELAGAGLKSSLDVSFATVNLGEARLLVLQAQNDARASFAALAAALGSEDTAEYQLDEAPLPAAPPADSAALVQQAIRDRPDVQRERSEAEARETFARAEGDLWRPTLSMAGAAGMTPLHQDGLADHYAAVGVNVTFPVFNGGLFAARRAEAGFRAGAQSQAVRDLEDRVARDVRVAWLAAQTSFERLDLTNQLLAQATESLDLAQQRYSLGLSSIVELTQAQLNLTRAQIDQASARYEYQERDAALRFQIGGMK
jgi:outer membrane protein